MLYEKKNPHGGDRQGRAIKLDFSVNTNPLGPPEAVKRAVVESANLLDQYPDPNCRELVKALAEHEGVPERYILCGSGAAELIYSYCGAARPRRALELAPTFSEYSSALEAAGCPVERWKLRIEDDFALQEDFLEALAESLWDALFLCNPNNPTGRLINTALLEEICKICHRRGVRLFLDECFLDLSDGGQSMKRLLADVPELFLLKAFTKTYAMAGLRLGYGLSADRALLAAMSRGVQPWNVSVPAQAAGAAALGETAYLERTRQMIREERAFLAAELEKLGLSPCRSQANYLLFHSGRELQKPLLERGILLRDCSNYRGLGPGWYRTAVRTREENRALLDALREIAAENCENGGRTWQKTL